MQSANYVRTELPIRIAHRIRDMQALPYVVVRQEMVAKVYEVGVERLTRYALLTYLCFWQLYWDAFEKWVISSSTNVLPEFDAVHSLGYGATRQ